MAGEVRSPFKVPSNCDKEWNPVCPHCGCMDSEVQNTYQPHEGMRRRRRICNNDQCAMPFYTRQPAEIVEKE